MSQNEAFLGYYVPIKGALPLTGGTWLWLGVHSVVET
jgi:hypothetical protein